MLADVSWMQDAIEDNLLCDTCNILEVTLTSDNAGGNTEAWGTITGGTAVACRVDYRAGREVITGGALLPYQNATISLPHSVTITPQNRIEVSTNVFSIQAVNTGQSAKAVTRCTCELVP
jgi:head-tail adaptor